MYLICKNVQYIFNDMVELKVCYWLVLIISTSFLTLSVIIFMHPLDKDLFVAQQWIWIPSDTCSSIVQNNTFVPSLILGAGWEPWITAALFIISYPLLH